MKQLSLIEQEPARSRHLERIALTAWERRTLLRYIDNTMERLDPRAPQAPALLRWLACNLDLIVEDDDLQAELAVLVGDHEPASARRPDAGNDEPRRPKAECRAKPGGSSRTVGFARPTTTGNPSCDVQ